MARRCALLGVVLLGAQIPPPAHAFLLDDGGRQERPVPRRLLELGLSPPFATGAIEESLPGSLVLNLRGEQSEGIEGVGLGLLVSSARRRVAGLQLAFGLSLSGGSAYGLQLAGLANVAREQLWGVQIGGLANLAGGTVGGLQVGVLGNMAGGPVYGIQVGGLGNVVEGALYGIQVGGLGNVHGSDLYGLQVAGLGNLRNGTLWGAQVGGLGNLHVGELTGLQVGGLFNQVGASLRGLQLALVNSAVQLQGMQLGLVNVTGLTQGLQLGLVNVSSRTQGAQVGLVNVAREMEGAPLGLINVVGDGILDLALWSDDVSSANLGLKYGSRWVYNIIHVGLRPLPSQELLQAGVGLGLRLPLAAALYSDLDLVAGSLWEPRRPWRPNALLQARAALAWQALDALAVYGGVTLNGLASLGASSSQPSLLPLLWHQRGLLGTCVAAWPGLMLGLHL